SLYLFCSLVIRLHPTSPLFPYTTLFRSSATCMPVMIESLADKLGFARARVELLVPLSVSLLRVGPVVFYVCATLFIAQLYGRSLDRKSTRLNSRHVKISYAVFCLKKKKT